jgi:protein-L-isoaspartate(D-aspartate) O-methyltransferase
MSFETQRKNMVESQLRPSDITDRRILRAMAEIPREAFLPPSMRAVAYMDADIPLAHAGGGSESRRLMAPRTFAKLLQLAEIEASDVVLDVGTGTGYSAAVIARLAGTVVALECDDRLAREARRALESLSLENVLVLTGDLAGGNPQEAPYDAIVLEGAVSAVPISLLEQLKDGGRLVAVHAPSPGGGRLGRATCWIRQDGTFGASSAFDAGAPALPGFEAAPEFVF